MPVLSGRIITPSSSDPMALVAVYNGEIVSWLWKLHFFLFCFDFVTWFCHNLNRHASLLRNVLTGNQTASFYFQVGIYSAVLSHHFARTKYMYIFRVQHTKKDSLLVKTFECVFYIFTYLYKIVEGNWKWKRKGVLHSSLSKFLLANRESCRGMGRKQSKN